MHNNCKICKLLTNASIKLAKKIMNLKIELNIFVNAKINLQFFCKIIFQTCKIL